MLLVAANQPLPGCDLQEIPVERNAIAWARGLSPQDAEQLRDGAILQGALARGRFAVNDVMPLTEAPRAAAAETRKPAATARPAPKRALWAWNPDAWRKNPEALFDLLAVNGADTVFITAPVTLERVLDPGPLAIFIERAARQGVRVWAVLGDPRAVLPAERPKYAAFARAYQEFNRGAPPAAKLAGLQLDIEPYLNQGYHAERDAWLDAYLDTVAQVRAAAGMPLDLAVPFWWGAQTLRGERLLDRLAPLVESVTVMNYRTDRRLILESAEPFLAWSAAASRGVRIALELGPIADESIRVYRPAEGDADFWLVPAGGRVIAVLLERPAKLPGQGLAYSHAVPLPGNRVSFRNNLPALRKLLPELEAQWRAWPQFGGVALHGVD